LLKETYLVEIGLLSDRQPIVCEFEPRVASIPAIHSLTQVLCIFTN